ncbi:hypothetical protein MES5069_1480007 [Mesorhizobium escarrei]|uniref:Uncharacterized protein n=1 Tax=Mesorhizobium escarrei TaxID=666018 RepID=A0ABM9DJK0_9HYPH|nr:hypothetical protein MES5069_1480007 [Mesorhizobium escarrei]
MQPTAQRLSRLGREQPNEPLAEYAIKKSYWRARGDVRIGESVKEPAGWDLTFGCHAPMGRNVRH